MFMACLYDEWYDEATLRTLRSFSILTTEPCTKLAWLHDRMPVILVGTDQARPPTHPTHTHNQAISIRSPYMARVLVGSILDRA